MSTSASILAHVASDPTQIHATQVHHDLLETISVNLTVVVADSWLTVAGPAPVLRALLTAQLAALDAVDPERGNHYKVELPFTPPTPAVVALTRVGVGW